MGGLNKMPTIFDSVIDFVRRILKIKKKVLVDKILSETEIESLDKEIEYERGYKEAQLAMKDLEIEQLKKKLKPDSDLDIKKFLDKQQKSAYNSQFTNALSVKKFFTLNSRKAHKLLSYDAQRRFGDFEDMLITTDGRIALTVKTKNSKEILIVGKTIKDIFCEFKGLSNVAPLGFLKVNLDSKRNYVENVLDREIPEVVIDGNGKVHISQINTKSFMEQLIEKEGTINELVQYISTIESALQNVSGSHNLAKIQSKYNKERAEVAETETLSMFKGVKEIIRSYNNMVKEITSKAVAQGISEDEIAQLEEIKDETLQKLRDKEGKEAVDIVEESYRRISDFLATLAKRVQPLQEEIKKTDETAPRFSPKM